jgi:hypothetical protein
VTLHVAMSTPVPVCTAIAAAVMAHLFDLVAGLLVSVAELLRRDRRDRRGGGGSDGEAGDGETGGGGESDQSLVHGDLLLLSVGVTVRRDRMEFAKDRLNRR